MEIKVYPGTLTEAQRKHLAGFILTYPANQLVPEHASVFVSSGDVAVAAPVGPSIASLVTAGTLPTLDTAIADLAKDGGEFDASQAFGAQTTTDAAAAAAFGAAPLPPAAPTQVQTPPPALPVSLPPVAVSPVPVTTAAIASTLDVNGLPWDARIHASTKTKTVKGAWTARRGTDPTLIATVEAELRALLAIPAPAGVAPPPPAAVAPPPPPNVPAAAVSAPVAAASGAGVTAATVTPPLPAGTTQQTTTVGASVADPRAGFLAVVQRTAKAKAEKKITEEEIRGVCEIFGITALALLFNRLDLVPQVAEQLDAIIASRS